MCCSGVDKLKAVLFGQGGPIASSALGESFATQGGLEGPQVLPV